MRSLLDIIPAAFGRFFFNSRKIIGSKRIAEGKKTKKENAWCKKKELLSRRLFVCCCRPMGDISIQKVLLQKKNLSSLPKKRRTIDFVLVKPQKDSKKKVSLGGVVQNQIKALVSFCTTFSFVGEKKPTLFEYKKVARR